MTVETNDPYIKPGPSEVLIDDFSRADWSGMLKALSQAPLFTAIQGTTNIDIAWLVWHDNLYVYGQFDHLFQVGKSVYIRL